VIGTSEPTLVMTAAHSSLPCSQRSISTTPWVRTIFGMGLLSGRGHRPSWWDVGPKFGSGVWARTSHRCRPSVVGDGEGQDPGLDDRVRLVGDTTPLNPRVRRDSEGSALEWVVSQVYRDGHSRARSCRYLHLASLDRVRERGLLWWLPEDDRHPADRPLAPGGIRHGPRSESPSSGDPFVHVSRDGPGPRGHQLRSRGRCVASARESRSF
jgi:hypothetical protein